MPRDEDESRAETWLRGWREGFIAGVVSAMKQGGVPMAEADAFAHRLLAYAWNDPAVRYELGEHAEHAIRDGLDAI